MVRTMYSSMLRNTVKRNDPDDRRHARFVLRCPLLSCNGIFWPPLVV